MSFFEPYQKIFDYAWNGNLDLIKKYLDHGGDINLVYNDGKNLLMFLFTFYSGPEIIDFLLDEGINIHHVDVKGRNILSYIFDFSDIVDRRKDISEEKMNLHRYETAKKLIKKGVAIKTSLLQLACGNLEYDFVKLLFDEKIKVRSHEERNLLSGVIESYHEDQGEKIKILNFLLENGIDINAKDSYGDTAIFSTVNELFSSYEGREKILEFMIEKGADINVTRCYGFYHSCWSLLHYTCDVGNITKTKILLDNGININLKNTQGDTPLLHCVRNSYDSEIVKLLIEYGADTEVRNNYGENIFGYLNSKRKSEVEFFIQSSSFDIKPCLKS